MHRRNRWWTRSAVALFAIGALIGAAACSDPEPPAAPETAAEATAAPATPAPATPAPATPAPDTPEPAALAEAQALVASVLAGVRIVDAAGFHGIAHDLAGAEELNPRLAGQVTNVLLVARQAAWPETLGSDAGELMAAMEALVAALEAEDLDAARAAAETVHDAQHDFSNAAYAWLAAQAGGTHDEATVAMPSTMAAIEIIDAAGFHGIAHDLAGAEQINPRLAGLAGNVLIATQAATWPTDLEAYAARLAADVAALRDAVEADDLDAARDAAEAVHDAQHDLSNAVHDWVANAEAGSHGSMAADFACLAAAIHKIDSAGFHGIAHDLAGAEELNPRLAGTMGNVLAHALVAPWPHAVEADAQRFIEVVSVFQGALEADDLETAREAAEAAHDAQHDLSNGVYVWMGGAGH